MQKGYIFWQAGRYQNEDNMKRAYLYTAVVIVIIAAIALLVVGANGSQTSLSRLVGYDNAPVPSGLLAQLSVPNNVSNHVGIGVASNNVKVLNKGVIELDGKPEVLYIGAEYCPFCAAERWGMIIALMRFGTFSNLHLMTSDAADYSPSTPTFTFYNSTYSSQYISFVSVEQTTNNKTALQQMNSSEEALLADYDPTGGIPFILFANRSVMVNSNYDPYGTIYGRNWSVIASDIHNSSSLQAQAIVGTANLITAQICEMDNNTPASVCAQQYIKSIASSFG